MKERGIKCKLYLKKTLMFCSSMLYIPWCGWVDGK
jgi:hypothetical protein